MVFVILCKELPSLPWRTCIANRWTVCTQWWNFYVVNLCYSNYWLTQFLRTLFTVSSIHPFTPRFTIHLLSLHSIPQCIITAVYGSCPVYPRKALGKHPQEVLLCKAKHPSFTTSIRVLKDSVPVPWFCGDKRWVLRDTLQISLTCEWARYGTVCTFVLCRRCLEFVGLGMKWFSMRNTNDCWVLGCKYRDVSFAS